MTGVQTCALPISRSTQGATVVSGVFVGPSSDWECTGSGVTLVGSADFGRAVLPSTKPSDTPMRAETAMRIDVSMGVMRFLSGRT